MTSNQDLEFQNSTKKSVIQNKIYEKTDINQEENPENLISNEKKQEEDFNQDQNQFQYNNNSN